MTWERVELQTIADLDRRTIQPSDLQGDMAYIGLEDVDGDGTISMPHSVSDAGIRSTKFRFSSQHVLYGKLRPYLRKIARPAFDGVCSTDIIPILPRPSVCRDYLFHFLRVPAMIDLATSRCSGANLPRLSPTQLARFTVPLPPLPEQKRIAAILDAADALRVQRRQALAQLDELLQASFLDLFGDPVINPKGWKNRCFSEFVKRLDGGKNVSQSETPTDYRVLKVSAVTSGVYRPNESKYLPYDFHVKASSIVRPGDLLISRANTANLIGATAYVWDTPANMVLPDKIWKFVWHDEVRVEPLFIYHVTQTVGFRRSLSQRASGTSGSMKNFAKPKLLILSMPLPPLALQQRFAAIAEAVEQQKARMQAHLAELDALFASLQARAFAGEL